MRIEGGLPDRKGRMAAEKAGKSSSKKNKRRQKKSLAAPTPVQRLFDTCREVFSHGQPGVVPSPDDVESLRFVLYDMKPKDVGLTQNMPYFGNVGSKGRRPPVTYLHLYKCDKFLIGIFCLPASAVIPLHNHPGMTVFSKLLFGSIHIKAFDWGDSPHQCSESNSSQTPPTGMRLAMVKMDAIITAPCNTSILYPAAGGNMHCFTALTSCAVLDVLGPPYSDDESRPCTYYNSFPYASSSGDSALASGDGEVYAWLQEREKPDDFLVEVAKYSGPPIVDSWLGK